MSDLVQLEMLTADEEPAVWTCPTCRGNRVMLRRLYADEVAEGGPTYVEASCRTCNATGSVLWDPDDHSWCPY